MTKTKAISRLLMISAFLVLVSGCTITIVHKFEDRYYTSTPGVQTPVTPTPSVSNNYDNMVEISHLGAGYDLVLLDPENLASEYLDNRSIVRPRVFVFEPDPDNFIDIKLLDREYRRNLPKGVTGTPLAGFRNSEKLRWTRTAREYQNSFDFKISGGGGAPGVAKFTGSAGFKNAQANTNGNQRIYLNKDGFYEGHFLAINLDYKHKLSPEFVSVVKALPTEGSTAAAYEAFIANWGTHFARDAKFGGKSSYRFTFTKDAYSSSSENATSFGVKAEGGAEALSFELGVDMTTEQKNKIERDAGAQSLEFISHGGSGATNFEQWASDATKNRVPIDAFFTSYLELFKPSFFPTIDPNVLIQKKNLLAAALESYFQKHGYNGNNDFSGFFERPDIAFQATVLQMEYTAVSRSNERDIVFPPIADTNNEIWGYLGLVAYDSKLNRLISEKITVLNTGNDSFIRREEGAIVQFQEGLLFRNINGNSQRIQTRISFAVKPTMLETGYVALLSTLYEQEIGLGGYPSPFPEKNLNSTDNRIMLSQASDEPISITLISKDGDILTFRIKLERLN